MKNKITIRTYPGGGPATGISYAVKLHADDSSLASGTTDGAGQFDYNPNLSPGPFYWEATDTAPTPDAVRKGSSKSSGSGGAYSLAEIPHVLRALGPGVIRGLLNACAVTYDGAGLDLDTDTGAILSGQGIPAVIASAVHQSVTTTRDATNPKQCFWVAEFTGIGQIEEGKVVLKDVCGSPAASPSLPSLTQSDSMWQEPLATFRLPNTSSTTLTQLTDVRRYVLTRNPVVIAAARRTDPAISVNVTSTAGVDVTWTDGSPNVTLLNGVTYDLTACSTLLVKAAAGQTISVAPSLAALVGGSFATFVFTNVSSDYVSLTNVHNLSGLVGTGAAVVNSLGIKVSGGTGAYLTGSMLVVATPRR